MQCRNIARFGQGETCPRYPTPEMLAASKPRRVGHVSKAARRLFGRFQGRNLGRSPTSKRLVRDWFRKGAYPLA